MERQKLTFLEKAWALACLPFLWLAYKHPKASGVFWTVAALLAAGWGDGNV